MAQGVNVLEPINEIEVQKDSHHTKINLFIYTLKQQMVRMQNHFDQRVFNAGTFLRNIQVTYEHAQLKGGGKDPYRVGLKLRDGGWLHVQGLTHFEVNNNNEFLIAGFNYEGQLAATIEISDKPFTL